jgi:hypothetical protein
LAPSFSANFCSIDIFEVLLHFVLGEQTMYIVTDLTRFSNKEIVCTALIELESGKCVRPMPYFRYEIMKQYGILPGAIFSGEFKPQSVLQSPHWEDCDYSELKYHGAATNVQFHSVLSKSAHPSVVDGFECNLGVGVKVIPKAHKAPRSIITLKIEPNRLEIVPDGYNGEKIKLHFSDSSGKQYRFMPITDLGFADHTQAHHASGDLSKLNEHIHASEEVYLRVGLGREYRASDGREGYWIQINGIYTFPSKLNLVRGYT